MVAVVLVALSSLEASEFRWAITALDGVAKSKMVTQQSVGRMGE